MTRHGLDCVDCRFETTVAGGLEAALLAADSHREDRDAGPADHFVNVSRLD